MDPHRLSKLSHSSAPLSDRLAKAMGVDGMSLCF